MWSDRHQSKFSASTSLTETNNADIIASIILMRDGLSFTIYHTAAMAQSIRAFASSHAEGWVTCLNLSRNRPESLSQVV